MKKIIIFTLGLLLAASCSKDNGNIVKRLNNAPAIIREVKGTNGLFVFELSNNDNGLYSQYVVPNGTLPAEYKEDGLSVFISGDVTSNYVAIDGYISENQNKGNTITLNGNYNAIELRTMYEQLECGRFDLNEDEYVTVQIVPEKISATTTHEVKIENHTNALFHYEFFSLEYFNKNGWIPIQTDFMTEDVYLVLFAGETIEKKANYYSLAKEYNEGKKGRYRIIRRCSLHTDIFIVPKEYFAVFKLCAEFEIE